MAWNAFALLGPALVTLAAVAACSDTNGGSSDGGAPHDGATARNPQAGAPAGDAEGHAPIPVPGQAEDVSSPTTVIGTGTPASCTGDAFVAAVAGGGVITFDCGPDPVTIVLRSTAKVFNNKG